MSRPDPPLMESNKVLAAARPPMGFGPSTGVVVRGLAVRRPPASVIVGTALMALVPLGLLALSVLLAYRVVVADGWLILKIMLFVPVAGIPFMLSALCWRGTKRAVHAGEYEHGLFAARLGTMGCGVLGSFLLWYVLADGNPFEFSMVVPYLVLVVLWLPVLPLSTRAARQWPDQVLLRRGTDATSADVARLLTSCRPHHCGATRAVHPHSLVAVADLSGRGWRTEFPCGQCGQPSLFREVPATGPPYVGGGDWLYLADECDKHAAVDPATVPGTALGLLRYRAALAVRATEALLALIPATGAGVVPGRLRTGRSAWFLTPETAWSRDGLAQRLADRRAVLARVEQECSWRTGTS